MNKCEELALGQSIKDLRSIANIVSEVLQVAGYQELQSQFSTKLHGLASVFEELKEISEVNHDTK